MNIPLEVANREFQEKRAKRKKELEEMTARFNEAETSKERIQATQNLRKARARVQATS